MGNTQTLKKWKSGESGNPAGFSRSRFEALKRDREAVIAELEALGPNGDATNLTLIYREMVRMARGDPAKGIFGSIKAAAFLSERYAGPPVQVIDLNANVQHVAREENVRSILEKVGVLSTVDSDAKPRVN
jgi:hypothetical protein